MSPVYYKWLLKLKHDARTDHLATTQVGRITGGNSKNGNNGAKNMGDPSSSFWNRNLQSAVVKKVLVLRVVAKDKQTTATEAELANKIFGASGDAINLKSLYNQCSSGQLQFEPQTSNNLIGTDGVYTVSLPNTIVTGADDGTIRDAAVEQASKDFGNVALTSIADHVMVCLPPGTAGGGWLAYAYVNYWLSVYNDDWCKSPSVQMHELGTFIRAIVVVQ
jgi:hypothetical protein